MAVAKAEISQRECREFANLRATRKNRRDPNNVSRFMEDVNRAVILFGREFHGSRGFFPGFFREVRVIRVRNGILKYPPKGTAKQKNPPTSRRVFFYRLLAEDLNLEPSG